MNKVVFVHASPAALAPLGKFYKEAAPDLEIVNLLDDGIMHAFLAGDDLAAERRLKAALIRGHGEYGAQAALVTCSAVKRPLLRRLQEAVPIPIVKIDVPMAKAAVRAGRRIGIVATFVPTVEITTTLLTDAAEEAGTTVEIVAEAIPEAYDSLLKGDSTAHDARLTAAAEKLAARPVDVIVLAQVSMSHMQPVLAGKLGIPVFASLTASLGALREVLR